MLTDERIECFLQELLTLCNKHKVYGVMASGVGIDVHFNEDTTEDSPPVITLHICSEPGSSALQATYSRAVFKSIKHKPLTLKRVK